MRALRKILLPRKTEDMRIMRIRQKQEAADKNPPIMLKKKPA